MDNLEFENIFGRGGESCGVKTRYMLNGVVEKRKPKKGDS